MNMSMSSIFKIGVLAGAAFLAGCEKHKEHSYDAPAVHHPPNEIGAPTRTPAPEPRTDTVPSTGSQQNVGTGNK
jgi:hypothetical protein